MVKVLFTQNIQRHVECPSDDVTGETVGDVLDAVFKSNPTARGYILDEQGAVRHHIVIFVDNQVLCDRMTLSDAVEPDSEIHVFQALSGG